ncbi:MAG: hypothetical protein HS117_20955 [Verrucomicrobiaceae bacterium]|nr:hypothetical protein [Verrucomicrobiaceae bacterium]
MSSGLVASVVCPVCGQTFLCQHHAAEAMVTCPHCAHQAWRGQFATQDMAQGLGSTKRRIASPQTAPAPAAAWPPPAPAAQAPVPPAAALQPEPAIWRQPPTQMSSAMLPTQTAPESPHGEPPSEFLPPHLQPSPLKRLLVAIAMVGTLGGGAWVWWDITRHPATVSASSPRVPEPAPEVRTAALATQTESASALHPPPDVAAFTKDVKKLIDTLFHAATPEERAACVHDAATHRTQIEALLASDHPQRPRLRTLGSVKGLSMELPGGRQVPLFNAGTSTCEQGALIRLVEGPDGLRRIHWPLLWETHQQTLLTALREKPGEPVWAWARIVPSHGFDIPAAERERFLSFDMHVTGEGKSPLTACVERDSPLGRFLDRETDWRQSYLTRLLVRKFDFGTEATIVAIADCEGTPAAERRARPQP